VVQSVKRSGNIKADQSSEGAVIHWSVYVSKC